MSRVITFSRVFPKYHPKAGQPTFFENKIWNVLDINSTDVNYDSLFELNPKLNHYVLWPFWDSIKLKYSQFDQWELIESNYSLSDQKHHTIRNGNRWKVGDKFSPRVWSDKPYKSKQIIIAPDIEVKKVWEIELIIRGDFKELIFLNDSQRNVPLEEVAKNDGLLVNDLLNWFNKPFKGQIISWRSDINY
jgi:hypothetical protein